MTTLASYEILELELSDEQATCPSHGARIAVVLRYRGYPVGFRMYDTPAIGRQSSLIRLALRDEEVVRRIVARTLEGQLPRTASTRLRPSVSVAICTRDRPGYLERCLESLGKLAPGPDCETSEFEVLVIDNAPSDERAREVAARVPGLRYLLEPRPGLNFARNTALGQARGELVAYLDDDVVVDRGWLAELAAAWRDEPQAGFFTGQVLPLELSTPAQVLFERRGGFRRSFEREYFGAQRDHDRHYPCGAGVFGTGANMILNRSAALAIGGFDIALDTGRPLPGGGDLDMFYRLIRAGYSAVYEPGCLVFHQHRREISELRRQYRDSWGKSLMAFSAKSWAVDVEMRATWTRLLIWWFFKQISDIARSIFGRSARPVSMILAELRGGCTGLIGEYGRSRRRVQRVAEDVA